MEPTIEAIKNNIRLLLQTEQGERVFQPNLGMNLRRFVLFYFASKIGPRARMLMIPGANRIVTYGFY